MLVARACSTAHEHRRAHTPRPRSLRMAMRLTMKKDPMATCSKQERTVCVMLQDGGSGVVCFVVFCVPFPVFDDCLDGCCGHHEC